MKYNEIGFNKEVIANGYSTGIIRRVEDDGTIRPPKLIVRGSGLTAGVAYVTIKLANGGIALIPLDEDEENGAI